MCFASLGNEQILCNKTFHTFQLLPCFRRFHWVNAAIVTGVQTSISTLNKPWFTLPEFTLNVLLIEIAWTSMPVTSPARIVRDALARMHCLLIAATALVEEFTPPWELEKPLIPRPHASSSTHVRQGGKALRYGGDVVSGGNARAKIATTSPRHRGWSCL